MNFLKNKFILDINQIDLKTYEGEIKLITNFQRARGGGNLAVNELDKWTPEGIMKRA